MSKRGSKMQIKKGEDIKVTNYNVNFLEVLIYEWLRRSIYFTNFRLSNAILKSIALKFQAILKLKSFHPTNEWIENYRKTYNLKNVHTSQMSEISYQTGKSTLPINIFADLKPKFKSSVDPKSSNAPHATLKAKAFEELVSASVSKDVNEKIELKEEVSVEAINNLIHEINQDCTDVKDIMPGEKDEISIAKEFDTYKSELNVNDTKPPDLFDIEDELPVCTIFGRKTVENVANIISSNPNSNDEKFQPMIVCTDPKNPNANAIKIKDTKEHTFLNAAQISEVEKIKDLINGKAVDTDLNTSTQNEFIDQFIKEIVRVPEIPDTILFSSSTNQLLSPQTENFDRTIFKPIERIQNTKKSQPKQSKSKSDVSPAPAVNNLDSLKPKEELLRTSKQKRYTNKNNTSLGIKIIDQTPTSILTTPDPTPPPVPPQPSPVVSSANLQTPIKIIDQTPTSILTTPAEPQPLPVVSTAKLQTETFNYTSPTVQQAWNPNFNANITSSFPGEINSGAQASIVGPGGIIYTFQMAAPNQNQLMPYISPMTANLQATSMGQPTTLTPIVLQFSSPLALQTTEMSPAIINLTQTPSMSQTNFMPTSTHFTNFIQNQFIAPLATFSQISAPTMSSTTTQQTTIAEIDTSNSTLVITPKTHISKCVQTKPLQQPVSTRAVTITPATSSLATPTPVGLPNFVSTKMLPTTTTHNNQPFLSSSSTTITPTSKASTTLTGTTPPTIANTSLKTIATTPMQVTITKKPRLTDSKKGTRFSQRAPLKTQAEVLKCIKLMEDFAMMNENFRLIGFLERLENQINVKKTT